MKFELSIKFNKEAVRKEIVDAPNQKVLKEKLKAPKMAFWQKNIQRITIRELDLK